MSDLRYRNGRRIDVTTDNITLILRQAAKSAGVRCPDTPTLDIHPAQELIPYGAYAFYDGETKSIVSTPNALEADMFHECIHYLCDTQDAFYTRINMGASSTGLLIDEILAECFTRAHHGYAPFAERLDINDRCDEYLNGLAQMGRSLLPNINEILTAYHENEGGIELASWQHNIERYALSFAKQGRASVHDALIQSNNGHIYTPITPNVIKKSITFLAIDKANRLAQNNYQPKTILQLVKREMDRDPLDSYLWNIVRRAYKPGLSMSS